MFQYFDYVMRVMFPEILIKLYMDVHGVTHEATEAEMNNAINFEHLLHTEHDLM